MSNNLDLRDIAIIDSFPVYDTVKEVLTVGCGLGRIETYLCSIGYNVIPTDIEPRNLPNFSISDIYNLDSFPVRYRGVVLASQVIEHLLDWRLAFSNLIKLTTRRLIITTPYSRSFFDPGHINFWEDNKHDQYNDVKEFIELAKPYSTSISKIRTKAADTGTKCLYLITVDKLQDGMND